VLLQQEKENQSRMETCAMIKIGSILALLALSCGIVYSSSWRTGTQESQDKEMNNQSPEKTTCASFIRANHVKIETRVTGVYLSGTEKGMTYGQALKFFDSFFEAYSSKPDLVVYRTEKALYAAGDKFLVELEKRLAEWNVNLVVFEVSSGSNPAIGNKQPNVLELFDHFSKTDVLIAPSPQKTYGLPSVEKPSVNEDGWR
jgi:hypothetical protein